MKSVIVRAGLHLQTHEKAPRVLGRKLLGFGDVSRSLHNRSTDGVDNAGFVIAHKGDDEVEKGSPPSLQLRVCACVSGVLPATSVRLRERNWRNDG